MPILSNRILAAVIFMSVSAGLLVHAAANQADDLEQAYRDKEHVVDIKALFPEPPESVVGEKIIYPGGLPAEINAALITIGPGEKTSWHRHGVPLFVYVMSGELDVDYGDMGIRTFTAGTAFMEAMDHRHRGINNSDHPVRLLAVYMGAEGFENVIAD